MVNRIDRSCVLTRMVGTYKYVQLLPTDQSWVFNGWHTPPKIVVPTICFRQATKEDHHLFRMKHACFIVVLPLVFIRKQRVGVHHSRVFQAQLCKKRESSCCLAGRPHGFLQLVGSAGQWVLQLDKTQLAMPSRNKEQIQASTHNLTQSNFLFLIWHNAKMQISHLLSQAIGGSFHGNGSPSRNSHATFWSASHRMSSVCIVPQWVRVMTNHSQQGRINLHVSSCMHTAIPSVMSSLDSAPNCDCENVCHFIPCLLSPMFSIQRRSKHCPRLASNCSICSRAIDHFLAEQFKWEKSKLCVANEWMFPKIFGWAMQHIKRGPSFRIRWGSFRDGWCQSVARIREMCQPLNAKQLFTTRNKKSFWTLTFVSHFI